MRDTHVLGINAYDHDVSACLLKDGEIVAAITKERLTRIKHDSGFYAEVVDYCLAEAGLSLERVDRVVLNTYVLPVLEMERVLLGTHHPYHLTEREREGARRSPLFLSDSPDVAVCSHHLAHAYSAFAVSPFAEGAVMVVDGVGGYRADVVEEVPPGDDAHPVAREAESFYRFEGERIETLRKVWMGPIRGVVNDDFQAMPGIGAVYSRVASYIFGHWNRCGEVMGLAPYGRPGVPRLFEVVDDELVVHPWPRSLEHPFTGSGDEVWEESPHREHWEDLAYRVQDDTEEALLARARWLHEATGSENLVMAGGVALNCVANGRILRETPFSSVYIQPAAGDDGVAVGCAYYGHLKLLGGKRTFVMKSAALGREYSEDEADQALAGGSVRLATTRRRTDAVEREAAALLARGKILGWHQGRSEFGPRALGQRSILADPRDPRMKDRVNAKVKHRQAFRPFAPVVMAERAAEFFEDEIESPFMLLVSRVRPEKRDLLPAVLHVDGTARLQTVREEDDPRLHALLRAFDEITGVPVLLNTSFNVKGDPIVETPGDALDCFLLTEIDALVIHDRIVTKRALFRVVAPLVRYAVRVRRALRSGVVRERIAASSMGG